MSLTLRLMVATCLWSVKSLYWRLEKMLEEKQMKKWDSTAIQSTVLYRLNSISFLADLFREAD